MGGKDNKPRISFETFKEHNDEEAQKVDKKDKQMDKSKDIGDDKKHMLTSIKDDEGDNKGSRQEKHRVALPAAGITEVQTRGILRPDQQLLRQSIASAESDEEEDRSSSSGNEELLPPKTMADVVLLVQSIEARKKRHKDISDIIYGVPLDMSELEKIGVICALEDCIDQLIILGKTNNKPTVKPDLKFTSLKDR